MKSIKTKFGERKSRSRYANNTSTFMGSINTAKPKKARPTFSIFSL